MHVQPTPSFSLTPLMLGSAAFVFLNFSLPIYARDIGASATAIGGTYSVFTLALILIRPLVGVALDRFGRRWFYVLAFGFYTLAMATFSLADGLLGFYIARLLQGVGAALMWVSVKTMTADLANEPAAVKPQTSSKLVTPDKLATAMGRLTAMSVRGSMLGAFYGFTLLGMMPLAQAWVWAFAGYALLALLGLLIALRSTVETRPPTTPQHQRKGPPLRTNLPALRLLGIVALAGFGSALIEPIYLIYLRDKFDLSIHALAFAFFPAGILFAILPIYGGRLAETLGYGTALALGMFLAALVVGTLPFLPSVLLVALCYTLFAVAWSLADPAEDALFASLTQADNRGQMFGYKEMFGGIGSALGPLAGGLVYDLATPEDAFVLAAAILIAASSLAYLYFAAGKRLPSNG